MSQPSGSPVTQLPPLPFPIVDESGMSASDWAAWASCLATLGLLLVTWLTLKSSKQAAVSAAEAAAATASQIQLELRYEPIVRCLKTIELGDPSEAEEYWTRELRLASTADRKEFCERMRDLHWQRRYDAAAAEHANKPTEHQFSILLNIHGSAVIVHRVVLIEYPRTREVSATPPMALSRTPNVPHEQHIEFIAPGGRFPFLMQPDDDYILEMEGDQTIAPAIVDKFFRRNRIIVEYTFEGGQTPRLKRARLNPVWSPSTVDETPLGGALTELPPRSK